MKIEIEKQLEISNAVGNIETLNASIDSSSMSFVFEMLSKSLYSNPIGSICRELASNCFDSHKEAGVEDAVIIKKGEDEEGTYISFIDFGVGLSPERIKNIYMNYFSSTKRETNNLIGGFGLGSKTPLAYTDYFYIITNYNNIKYNYVFSKGKTSPTLDLLDEMPTNDKNGTEIKIIIKNYEDVIRFENELIKQLCYFDNIYFDNWGIENDYKIYNLNNFKYKACNQYSESAHILLGKVAYPIDWDILNFKPITVPIGIKFDIGELQVTPNRENIRYTDEAKILITTKLNNTYQELIDLYKKQTKSTDNYFEWIKNIEKKKSITLGESTLILSNIKEINDYYKCTLFEDDVLNIKEFKKINFLDRLYCFKEEISNTKKIKNKWNRYISNYLNVTSNIYIDNNNQTIKEAHKFLHKNLIVFKPIIDFKNFSECLWLNTNKITDDVDYKFGGNNYFNLGFSIKLYKFIKELRRQTNLYFKELKELSEQDLLAYKNYKKENKESKTLKSNEKISLKLLLNGNQTWYTNSHELYIKTIENYKGIIIYGFRDDTVLLKKATVFMLQFKNFVNEKSCKVIQISKENEKYFKNKKNMTNVNDLYGDNILFRRLASSLKIENYFIKATIDSTYDSNKLIEKMNSISLQVGENLKQLKEYYKQNSSKENAYDISRKELKNDILNIANKLNLFDPKIELIFKNLDEWFKGVELIKFLEINEDSLPFILKLLRDNKKKLNLDYYKNYVIIENKLVEKDNQLRIVFKEETNVTKFNILTKTA